MKRLTSLFVVIAVLLLSGVSAFAGLAPTLYGVAIPITENMKRDETLSADMIEQAMFYSINPETGAAFEIGPTGFGQCSSLDFEPETNELFAVCRRLEDIAEEKTNAIAGDVLIRLDMLTGQGIEVGPLNIMEEDRVSDISFRWDGRLFAHVNARGIKSKGIDPEPLTRLEAAIGNYLGIINTETGQLTMVGTTEYDDEFSAIGFSGKNNLYHGADNG